MRTVLVGASLSAALALVACGGASSHGPTGGASSTSSGTSTGGAGGAGADGGAGGVTGSGGSAGGALPAGPTRYPHDQWASPITEHVAEALHAIAANDGSRKADVFMKVGASETVNTHLFHCLAGTGTWKVDLADNGVLLPSMTYFRGGNAAGTTPFDRTTLAAKVGVSATWPLAGSPSPLDQEIAALDPRFAFVNYGTNDMQQGTTHATAAFPFHESMSALLDRLQADGIIPIVVGLNPRDDTDSARGWVPTYDAITRGIAEARQLPYFSLYLLMKDLPGMGLVSDGVHGNSYYEGGSPQPCVFTVSALAYNHNVRNLSSLRVLDAVKRVVVDLAPAPDSPPSALMGDGTAGAPFVVDRLPFTHAASTKGVSQQAISAYPGCSATQDESGPELLYRLDVTEPTPIRAMVFDRAGVDIDLHLLSAPSGDACLARNDRILQRTLAPGTYYFSLDSYVSGGAPQAGEYLFVVVRCEPGDPDCA